MSSSHLLIGRPCLLWALKDGLIAGFYTAALYLSFDRMCCNSSSQSPLHLQPSLDSEKDHLSFGLVRCHCQIYVMSGHHSGPCHHLS